MHLMTTYDQTALVYRRDTPLEFATIARRPVLPPELLPALENGHPAAIRRYSDDAEIQWWPDGLVKVIQTDGVQLYFWSKPTLRDAMDYRQWNGAQGPGFFKFNSDGSVYAKCFGSTCYWGPDLPGYYAPENGAQLVSMQANDGTWIFEEWGDDMEESDDDYRYRDCECRY
jgi:hypothetical protein